MTTKNIWTKIYPYIDMKMADSLKLIDSVNKSDLEISLFGINDENKRDTKKEIKVVFKAPILSYSIIDFRMAFGHEMPLNLLQNNIDHWLFEITNSEYLEWFNKDTKNQEAGRTKHYVIYLINESRRIDVISYFRPKVCIV